MTMPSTRFRGVSRPVAIGVIAGALVLLAWFFTLSLQSVPPAPAVALEDSDMALYKSIVARLYAGEDYYVASHHELVTQGYGTQSVFNWRTPMFLTVLGLLPSLFWAQKLLLAMAMMTWALVTRLAYVTGGWKMAGPALALSVLSMLVCFTPDTVLFSEIVVGVLILMSACLYGLDKPAPGFAVAVVALFVRELAAPYAVICMVMAWRSKRYWEMAAWGVALLAYVGYFALHAHNVHLNIRPEDPGYPDGWLQFGGAAFVLKTAAFNGIFVVMPLWVTALVLPLAVIGLAAWPGMRGEYFAVPVFAYLALFSIVGKPFNEYWGALYTPLMTMGLVWCVPALVDLTRAIRFRRAQA